MGSKSYRWIKEEKDRWSVDISVLMSPERKRGCVESSIAERRRAWS